MEHQAPPFFIRGISPKTKLIIYGLLSLALLIIDSRYRVLDVVREKVSVLLYPLQVVATTPITAAHRLSDFLSDQARLRSENERLHNQQLEANAQLLRMRELQAENDRLRGLLGSANLLPGQTMFAEILYTGRDPFTRKVIVNRGTHDAVVTGQPVIDDAGVLGQVTRVHELVSEVTLLTEKGQPVPVQIQRNGLRAVVFGTGQATELEVRFLPLNADIQVGDILVTSGIDGTYPPGLPVAIVQTVDKSGASNFARIVCRPAGNVEKHRYLLILKEKRDIPPPPEPEEPQEGKKKPRRGGH
ncbi:rod shape-determining protein MreC [Chitinivorax tropicus]|uniref:Cell shape-determining protein MreC n=1 Tax=Chitinivorax tropicus TaxID=714531 RepID=A0A840MP59_9PROT|nr:rod shape-determining protein MreC [Chitinivorax tropicus]MBB5017963.1 rod shape-determining protein MreC [Chitinivorax tropicus]